MIRRPTTFVLGAGAHCSYGFPSGRKLKIEVADTVDRHARGGDGNAYMQLYREGKATLDEISPKKCREFALALRESGQPSIDAFLNATRHAGYERIGKLGIAEVLLRYEATMAPFESKDDDWLSLLLEIMLEGIDSPEAMKNNQISFVTFNYDGSLEKWLHRKVRASFEMDSVEAFNLVKTFEIHHVYGDLGSFTLAEQPPSWSEAAQRIRTIYEAQHDQKIINRCKELLYRAKTICLLGFGFHEENIRLIELDNAVSQKVGGVVAASAFDITQAEWKRLTSPWGNAVQHSHESYKCRLALRHLNVF